jgi:hypothetical protein
VNNLDIVLNYDFEDDLCEICHDDATFFFIDGDEYFNYCDECFVENL